MSTYLLLRNNKESGPYTLDELQIKGLKAYDLVWVEGKSAAWRYPSELEELKKFAPIIEEQPYDRFFKKSPEKAKEDIKSPVSVEKDKPKAVPVPQAVVLNLDNRNVYVTMPAGQTFVAAREPAKSKDAPAKENDYIQKSYTPVTPAYESEQQFSRPTTAPNYEKFEHSGADLQSTNPEIFKKNPLPNTKKSNNLYLLPVFIGICTLLLLAIGIFIGMRITDRGTNSTNLKRVDGQFVAEKQQAGQQLSLSKPADPIPAEKNDKFLDSVATIVAAENKTTQENKANAEKKRLVAEKLRENDSLEALKKKAVTDSPDFTINHRESTHREGPITNPTPKINLADFVSISVNKYTIGTFGGISDLQLTVKNQFTYPLDLAVVEVQYIQSNKKVFKTENLYFRDLAPGSVLTQEAPKSPRGIKIQYRLTLVNSKQSGLSYSGI